MENNILSRVFLVLLISILFIVSQGYFNDTALAKDDSWKVWQFEEGQMFSYELKREQGGVDTYGEVTFWIQSENNSDSNEIAIKIEGEFDQIPFSTSIISAQGDINNIASVFNYVITQELPPNSQNLLAYTLLFPWRYSPIYGKSLSEEWEYDDDGINIINSTEKKSYSSVEGYLVNTEWDPLILEICVNPEFPLPLMASATGLFEEDDNDESILTAILVDYK